MILFEFCAENLVFLSQKLDESTDSRKTLVFFSRKFDESTDSRKNT